MRKPWTLSLTVCLALLALLAATPAAAGGVTAGDAFDQLKSLAGTWTGDAEGEGEEAEAEAAQHDAVHHDIKVSAGGTVVMETMAPGSPHEMINMYHVDGDDLLLTHYCAGGNQPQMKLDREKSSADKLVFDFVGGTNFDPAVDPHIHSAELTLAGDEMVSSWTAYAGGEQVGGMKFHLSRSE